MATVAEKVQNGIEWLNENEPSWIDRVDVDTLAIHSCFRCVLGQLYGYFFGELRESMVSDDKCENLGFRVSNELYESCDGEGDKAYDDLTAEWKRRIIELRR